MRRCQTAYIIHVRFRPHTRYSNMMFFRLSFGRVAIPPSCIVVPEARTVSGALIRPSRAGVFGRVRLNTTDQPGQATFDQITAPAGWKPAPGSTIATRAHVMPQEDEVVRVP